jgi:ubiquinone/menaquinone biosynthesis C-methylase UbiE
MTQNQSTEKKLLDTRVPHPVAIYSSAARIYDTVLEPPLRNMRRAVSALAGVGDGMRVLDVCCGTGVQARRFADAGAWVTGADMSPHMLDRARARECDNLRFVLAASDQLPFADRNFDLVSLGLALHEIPDALRLCFVAEMRRVARSGGRILIMDYGIPPGRGFIARLYGGAYHLAERMAGGAHYRNYCGWMEQGGLSGFAARSGFGGHITEFYGGAMAVLVAPVSGAMC